MNQQAATKSSYELRRFEDATAPDFMAALQLYRQYTPASVRTSTNEIVYWLSNYEKQGGDELFLFGFFLNDDLVGYAQLVLFTQANFLIIDYLVIDERRRSLNVFFEFFEHIKAYLLDHGYEPRFAVAEVAHYSMEEAIQGEAKMMARLLKFAGFRAVKAPYYQPMLGTSNYESKMRATLLMFSIDPLQTLRRETYLQIVRSVYYDHYLRWYSMYDQLRPLYRQHIDELWKEIEQWAESQETVDLSGHANGFDARLKTIQVEHREAGRFARISILWILLSTITLVLLIYLTSVSTRDLLLVFGALFLAYILIVSIFSEEARAVAFKVLDFIQPLVGKRK